MSRSPAQFAIRTLRPLEVLAFTPTTASGIADALHIHPRRARRLLSQLQRDGWLSYRQGSTERIYAPTLRFIALAAEVAGRAPLTILTASALESLHAATGHPAMLTIPGYGGTVCVARCLATMALSRPCPRSCPHTAALRAKCCSPTATPGDRPCSRHRWSDAPSAP